MKDRNKEISGYAHIDKKIASYDIYNILINHLKEEHNFTQERINELVKKDDEETMIPISIFNTKLGALETITKYLIEVAKLKNSEVAKILNRNIRTIWSTYDKAKKKLPLKFILGGKEKFFIPTSRFRNRSFSTLEIIVKYLKEGYNLNLHNIAILIKRDDSTVWTVYNRVKNKEKQDEKK